MLKLIAILARQSREAITADILIISPSTFYQKMCAAKFLSFQNLLLDLAKFVKMVSKNCLNLSNFRS